MFRIGRQKPVVLMLELKKGKRNLVLIKIARFHGIRFVKKVFKVD
jgi:hypothetical protein